MSFRRPKFDDLPEEEKATFGNGVGAGWMPGRLRNFITERMNWFFEKASWRHHDFGYAIGGDELDRWRADFKFLCAMLKDAMTQSKRKDEVKRSQLLGLIRIPIALIVSVLFFLGVLFFGWSSFNYRQGYATTQDALKVFVEQRAERRGHGA